ncbi:MAG: hypothetical protein EBS01_03360 [Verrucomicrobia bacterium]|nr:hypothetical protein [Verrucomicrobiota bacterium]
MTLLALQTGGQKGHSAVSKARLLRSAPSFACGKRSVGKKAKVSLQFRSSFCFSKNTASRGGFFLNRQTGLLNLKQSA